MALGPVHGLMVAVMMMMGVTGGRSPMLPLGKEPPRTLQMIGAASPRMLHRISADLKPDASQVVHIQVPYYIERPKRPKKKFQPWPLRGQRFASLPTFPHTIPSVPIPFGLGSGSHTESAFKQQSGGNRLAAALGVNPGPYDTPFVPVMKPSPVNPLHREPPPEIMFEPISILPLETPSFDTLRNHVNFLKHKQAAFFEGQGREFGFGEGAPPAAIPDELDYFGEHERQLGEVHKGDAGGPVNGGEQNTLSEDDFGQNDRKYDRRGVPVGREGDESSTEEDFYDTDERRQHYAPDEDFEDSREESDRAAAFEPKKVYTQVRHQETTRHVRPAGPDEDDGEDDDGDDEDEDRDDRSERANDEEADEPEHEEDAREENEDARPIRERVKEARKNIVYSEQGHEASKFDHGSAESYGQFEQQQKQPDAGSARRKRKRPRIKRSAAESADPDAATVATSGEVDEVAIILLTGNDSLPLAEALTDPRELHGDELIRFLDEAIANTTQYLPDTHLDNPEVINIVAPPSNVVKFPYYNRPVSEIDVDSALRYAENLTTFSGGGPYGNRGDVECNEVDVNIADEPEPTGGDGDGAEQGSDGFRPIKRLQGLGGKIECLKVRHFGHEPLDNPLFREEFVGGWPRKSLRPTGPAPAPTRQPNPAVAVYNDVIRHIKKHLASQQQRKKNAKPDEPDTLMIAVPRVLRLPAAEAAQEASQAAVGVKPARKREAKIISFPQANPGILSNHVSFPIFDISKYFPRFMMRANDDLYADEPDTKVRQGRLSTPKPRTTTKATHLRTLVRTAEQLAEGAVEVEESVERQRVTTGRPGRDDIADAFDDLLGKPLSPTLKPLQPIKPYDVVEDTRDTGPEPTYNKSGPPYAALALEPPVAQSILSQRLEPVNRNQLDFLKAKRSAKKPTTAHGVLKRPRPGQTRKKVLVFYHR
ncbi:uncharacterized protein LOC128266884 [Anopheles cruzii]|uniref:uncharacterized protein LOC128266884 n=1 Tax=Anopheles cruzii TaxID=68878 RepID=UPI0022EC85D8|nr:uncharacterized protein LOC128266884 [Anopheles cruzii]